MSTTICWKDISLPLRAGIVVITVTDFIGKAAAWHFLYHRPAETFRGPKWAWVLVTLINGIGPMAFFAFAPKKSLCKK